MLLARTLTAALGFAALVAGAGVAPVRAQNGPTLDQTPVATVNGQPIPAYRVDLLVRQAVAQGRPDTPQLRNAVKQELINREILVQDARKKGLDKNAVFAARMEMLRDGLLLQFYAQDFARSHRIPEDTLKAEYERLKGAQSGQEYLARHILVRTEEEAREAIGELAAGTSFAEVAKTRSLDPTSKDNGGALPWRPAGAYVKPFAEALGQLSKGETTQAPVQSQFGWHVIQLQDARPFKMPPYDQAKNQIASALYQQALLKNVADLRKQATVKE